MTAAAFKACFTDWKLIRGRKCVQIVFEVPVEAADEAYHVLGGMPDPGKSVWCAIARLRDTNAADQTAAGEADAGTTAWTAAASPSKQRKPVAPEKRLANQAGKCCADPRFWKFIGVADEIEAAKYVRNYCHVDSRSKIIPGTAAGNIWENFYGRFLGWRDHDMPAGAAA